MLTTNKVVGDGLNNVAMGTVTYVIVQDAARWVEAILVHFDNANVGAEAVLTSIYKHIHATFVPIKQIDTTFHVWGKIGFQGSWTQFPLFLSWAVTIHKCQGITLPEIVVDMSREKCTYDPGQAYIALSCVTQFEKLHILNYNWEQIRIPSGVETEMVRLQKNTLPCEPSLIFDTTSSSQILSIAHFNVANLHHKCLDVHSDKNMKKHWHYIIKLNMAQHNEHCNTLHVRPNLQFWHI